MKRLAYTVLISALIITFSPLFVDAHPGRTAGDGCHYCRTNCDSWGVGRNVRHCHGGSTYAPPPPPPSPPPTQTVEPTQTEVVVPEKEEEKVAEPVVEEPTKSKEEDTKGVADTSVTPEQEEDASEPVEAFESTETDDDLDLIGLFSLPLLYVFYHYLIKKKGGE